MDAKETIKRDLLVQWYITRNPDILVLFIRL